MAHVHRSGDEHSPAIGRLTFVLALTAFYALAEVIGGWLSNSLALLADAGHMLTDVMALALAVFAAWAASRPADPTRTYGYQRAEILAALLNGVALIVIALVICKEAWQRWSSPPEVHYGLMALVATGGLVINVIGARALHGHQHNINVRAAYLHVLGDLLGSIGALAAAGLIAWRGWLWADPAASVVIAIVIVFGAVRLVKESVNVLMEGAPSHLDSTEVRSCLEEVSGVCEVHDLHLWSLGGNRPILTAHLVLDHSRTPDEVLRTATNCLGERFGIKHSTLQLEAPDYNIVQLLGS